MQRTGFSFLSINVFLITWMYLMGCSVQFSSLPQFNQIQTDTSFIQFMEKSLGTDWYGVYIKEGKVGYIESTSNLEKGPEGEVYKIQLSGIINIPSQNKTDEMKITTVSTFDAHPPYSLIQYDDKIMFNADISETKLVRTPKGYEASILQGGETRTNMIGTLYYNLKDYTAVQRWITRNPKYGAKVKYPYLNIETLTLEEHTTRIAGIHKYIISGVKVAYFDVITIGIDGLEVQEKFGVDGTPYLIVLGGIYECRLEPKSIAINIDGTAHFFLKNTVSVNRQLGDPEKVALLKLSFDNPSGVFLDNSPGQLVSHESTDDFVIVTLSAKGIPWMVATKEEIKKNLVATIDIPAHHPTITDLAHHAVGDAVSDSEKTRRLIKFVYQYIEDDYTANPLTVMEIIRKKKGDCSEHAKLFTAMSRAIGIPCRTVGGLVYLGDEVQEFGLHAWNEVVIDGMWMPVDPTWGQTLVDATHIRFPTDITDEWQILAAIPNMKIEVLYVEHKK